MKCSLHEKCCFQCVALSCFPKFILNMLRESLRADIWKAFSSRWSISFDLKSCMLYIPILGFAVVVFFLLNFSAAILFLTGHTQMCFCLVKSRNLREVGDTSNRMWTRVSWVDIVCVWDPPLKHLSLEIMPHEIIKKMLHKAGCSGLHCSHMNGREWQSTVMNSSVFTENLGGCWVWINSSRFVCGYHCLQHLSTI